MHITVGSETYEVQHFKRVTAGITQKVYGVLFAQGFLAVGNDNRIYNTISGEPVLHAKFETLELAINFAKRLAETYYNVDAINTGHEPNLFYVWKEYPRANIFSWFKCTVVPDGTKMYEMMLYLSMIPDTITAYDIKNAELKVKE